MADPGKSVLKAAVQCAVCIESGNPRAVLAIHREEKAPNEDLAIALYRDRKDIVVDPGKSVLKPAVQGAVLIQPRNVGATHAVDRSEPAPDEYPAITLHGHRIDESNQVTCDKLSSPGKSVLETVVQSAVRIEPRNVGATHAVDRGEAAPDDQLAIALHRDRIDLAFDPGKSVLKAAVQGA